MRPRPPTERAGSPTRSRPCAAVYRWSPSCAGSLSTGWRRNCFKVRTQSLPPAFGAERTVENCLGVTRLYHKLDARSLLQLADDFEQVTRLRIPCWAKHAHETFGRGFGNCCKALKAYRGIDVIPQDRLAHVQLARKKSL